MEPYGSSGSAEVGPAPILTVDPEPERHYVDSATDRRWPLFTLLAILILTLLVLAAVGQSVGDASDPIVSPDTTAEPAMTTAPPEAGPADRGSPWPDPPDDHAPIVIGAPPSGEPIAANLPGHTLVYVNTIDRPTVIDLRTGGRQELAISDARDDDRFLVEDGFVVDNDPLNPDLPAAGLRAIAVTVHRSAAPEAAERLPHDGWKLCLDPVGCDAEESEAGSGPIRVAGQLVTRLPAYVDGMFEQIFAPESVATAGRFYIVTGPTGAEVKVPVPRAGSPLWLISDPGDGAGL